MEELKGKDVIKKKNSEVFQVEIIPIFKSNQCH